MFEETVAPEGPQPIESMPWHQVWLSAVTRPSVELYRRILQDPRATTQRAYGWMAVAALVGFFISLVLTLVFGGGLQGDLTEFVGSLLTCGVCGAVLVPVAAVLGLVVSAGLAHLIARAMGGTGTYAHLAYLFAAFYAPLEILSALLASIPLAIYLDTAVVLFGLALSVIAVRAVHGFGTGKAIVCVVVGPVLVVVIAACVVIGLLVLIGPVVGNVYSEIIEGINLTATP